ncbi:hypothetical protein [Mycolicibacterium canariasense]|nr:hypothetical protein [Mycolicibacterium canariasense]
MVVIKGAGEATARRGGSHLALICHPDAVTAVILDAARSVG